MFRRLIFEDSAAVFTLAAFVTAVSIYVTITWRALRMKRPQLEQFENLPFAVETPVALRVSAGTASTVAPEASRRTPGGPGSTSSP